MEALITVLRGIHCAATYIASRVRFVPTAVPRYFSSKYKLNARFWRKKAAEAMAEAPAVEESGFFWQSRRGGSEVGHSEDVTEFGRPLGAA